MVSNRGFGRMCAGSLWMSPRDWQDRVRDILDAMAEIRCFTSGMDRAAFVADTRTQRAV
jgi:uncharacterized protein with HEPN domain